VRSGSVACRRDFDAVEFLPSPDSSGFKLVGTNFTNLLTPLLRYVIGDMVSLGKGSCECGCGGRLVQTIDGRQEDYVVLGNSTRIERLDHVFKDMLSIQQAQIYQKLPGAIIVYIVRGDDYSPEAEHALLLELRQRLGPQMKIDIQYRDTLERFGAGKLHFAVSDPSEGSLLSPAERSAAAFSPRRPFRRAELQFATDDKNAVSASKRLIRLSPQSHSERFRLIEVCEFWGAAVTGSC
jgi:phenylacetate-CoA ligase